MDGARIFASSSFVFTPLGETWFKIDQALGTLTLNTLQALIQRYVHPVLWDPVFVTILGAQDGWCLAYWAHYFYFGVAPGRINAL